MLAKMTIKNFKSIGDDGVSLNLKPLTILVGLNGSGKSSILEAIALLAQSIQRNAFTPTNSLIQYEMPQIAHKGELRRWISLEVRDEVGVGLGYQYRPDTGEARETLFIEGKELVNVNAEGDLRTGLKLVVASRGETTGIGSAGRLGLLSNVSSIPWEEIRSSAEIVARRLGEEFANVFLIGASRGEIPQAISTQAPPSGVGVHGENVVALLAYLMSPNYEDVMRKVVRWSGKFGLLSLWAGVSNTGQLEARFRDPNLKQGLNLALAGHGSRQVVSVIAQLFWCLPGSIILIEEPEISLHPEAQLNLCELFADAVAEGKQVVITTHTSILLLSLSHAISKRLLKASDVAVYEVTKSARGTAARPVRLSKEGYIRGWVPSFVRAEQKLLRGWMESLPES